MKQLKKEGFRIFKFLFVYAAFVCVDVRKKLICRVRDHVKKKSNSKRRNLKTQKTLKFALFYEKNNACCFTEENHNITAV